MIYGYNFNNDHLVSFSAATPGTLLSDIQLTGLRVGESLVGIDFRPATGQLYAVGSDLSTDRVVSINPTTGVVTSVGGTTPSTPDIFFGTDFNPVVDRLRVVGDADTNRRFNPNDGTLAGTDTTLAYAAGDPGFGRAISSDVVWRTWLYQAGDAEAALATSGSRAGGAGGAGR